MSESPESLEVAHQWIEKAEHDLRNAEHTLTLEEDCLSTPFASTPNSAPKSI